MKRIAGFLAFVLLTAGAFGEPVPDSFWAGRLWLTSQAFGLE
jgi:hypothetical protein